MIPAVVIFLKGVLIGLVVSMPLGPIGIILINRTLKRGILSGFISGLGLAVADTILAFLAAFGFTVILGFIEKERFIISLIGGGLILGAGLKVFFSNPVKDFRKKDKVNKSLWRDFYSVVVLAFTNPFTVFVFVAFFSGINLSSKLNPHFIQIFLIPGVFIGAITWWLFLSYFVNRFKKKISLRRIVKINKIAGAVIILTGIIILAGVFNTLY